MEILNHDHPLGKFNKLEEIPHEHDILLYSLWQCMDAYCDYHEFRFVRRKE